MRYNYENSREIIRTKRNIVIFATLFACVNQFLIMGFNPSVSDANFDSLSLFFAVNLFLSLICCSSIGFMLLRTRL